MNNIKVTSYCGFSKVRDTLTLSEFFQHIRNGKYAAKVFVIHQLAGEGKIKEANNRKRQLDFFTVTAVYQEKRLPESIETYNDLITIDIDGLSNTQVETFRPLIEQDPTTVGCFLTPKQHGFKIIASLQSDAVTRLKSVFLATEPVPYPQLEKYHSAVYELTRIHYETLLGTVVDTSGKDISRGIFASFDPQMFFSPERAEGIRSVRVEPLPPQENRDTAGNDHTPEHSGTPMPVPAKDPALPDPATCLEFKKCIAITRRTVRYEEGSHNTFLFALGNWCFRRKLDEATVKQLAAKEFGENGRWDTDTPISNGYTYTNKIREAEKTSAGKLPTVYQVLHFLEPRYTFRRNIILDRLEFCEHSPKAPEAEEDSDSANPADPTGHISHSSSPSSIPGTFRPLATKDLNTLFLHLNEAGISYPLANLKAIIDSDYAREFDPLTEYFHSIPPWDGKTDFITQLADTITTDDTSFWRQAFSRWITGMVACATGMQHANQQALILYGKQGKGKSTWIRRLLPPELREYYRNGMIDPVNKDDLLLLSTRILINMEEFEGVRTGDIAELKRIITQENVTIRKAYDIQTKVYPRRASFIGSSNNMQFLKDISGSRRFLVIRTEKIDYRAKIDYDGVYAQVMHLLKNGYQYWFEGEEVESLNARNERHRIKDPLEENLYIYFRQATPKDYTLKWIPAAAILSHLSIYGRTQANTQAQQILVQLLERDRFMKRVNKTGITEYGVVERTPQEIDESARKIEGNIQLTIDIEQDKTK